MYALADCNNFFASCERVFRPELNGKPVIVLSNNDGCAIARSNEAKALGIKMGDPYFKIKPIIERNNVAVFSSNFALYGDMSARIQEVLRGFAPSVEVYSIDEAFLDLTGVEADFDALAKTISRECRRLTAIPVSVGISPTKTLAKIASKLCKKYPKLQGGCYMWRPRDIEKVLRTFPVEDVWGIGRRSVKKLAEMGVKTAWDYTQLQETTVRKLFNLPGFRTWKELRGIPCIEFEDMIEPKQSICISRSFAHEVTTLQEFTEQVATFASRATAKLRAQNTLATEMAVFAMTNRFKDPPDIRRPVHRISGWGSRLPHHRDIGHKDGKEPLPAGVRLQESGRGVHEDHPRGGSIGLHMGRYRSAGARRKPLQGP